MLVGRGEKKSRIVKRGHIGHILNVNLNIRPRPRWYRLCIKYSRYYRNAKLVKNAFSTITQTYARMFFTHIHTLSSHSGPSKG